MRDCFREGCPEGTLSLNAALLLPVIRPPSLVDCAAWISRNKGIISGALVPTRAGANYECGGRKEGAGGDNSRAHRCGLKLKRELHRFSGGTLTSICWRFPATCLKM